MSELARPLYPHGSSQQLRVQTDISHEWYPSGGLRWDQCYLISSLIT